MGLRLQYALALIAVTACGARSSLGVLVIQDADGAASHGADAGDAEPVPVDATGAAHVVEVSAGDRHTCALLSSGGVRCWGDNSTGELGDGTTTERHAPVDVGSLGGSATAISTAGYGHTCALLSTGAIRCWGYNSLGQLGDGTTTERHAPVDVGSLGGSATAVSTGATDTCALLSIGTLRCWGNWPVGDGTLYERNAPVDVLSLGGTATLVSAGWFHTCAVLSSGTVRCWGQNIFGDLGDGTNAMTRRLPVDVVPVGGTATLVSAGGNYTCAVLSSGAVRCWGSNDSGQLGVAGPLFSDTPADVVPLGGSATQVSAGFSHACALLASGAVQCWGDATELDGSINASPMAVSLEAAATQVSAGGSHSCALLASGGVRCWGANEYGQLGDGTTTDSTKPVTVVGLP